MTNSLYPLGRSAFARAEVDWVGDTFRAYALDVDFVYDEGHEFLSDTAYSTTELDHVTLSGTQVLPGGVCDADDTALAAVPNGDTVRHLIIVRWTADPATSALIYHADSNRDGTPMARTSDGTSMPLRWSDLPSRVFRL